MAKARPRFRQYAAGVTQAPHRHEFPHLSLTLAGDFVEDSGGSEARIRPGMFALRPEGFGHEVRFGPSGAMVVSLPLDDCDVVALGEIPQCWLKAPESLLRSALLANSLSEDTLWDLIATATAELRRNPPARWLTDARDSLIEDGATIDSLAQRAGVHRVHFSRAFVRAFGLPPSVFRRQMATLRAASAAIEGRSAADAAYACGFADQSHMIRNLKRSTGLSFSDLRRLGGEVTSVQ